MFGTRNRVRDGIKSALGRVFRRETELPAEPYPPLCRLVAAYDAESASPDILYLGDSVLERVAHQDRDRRLVHEMLADRVAERHRVCGLSHAAFNPAVYLALVRCLTRLKQRPKTVIIPVTSELRRTTASSLIPAESRRIPATVRLRGLSCLLKTCPCF